MAIDLRKYMKRDDFFVRFNQPTVKGRWFKDGKLFSRLHMDHLPKAQSMIDIDEMVAVSTHTLSRREETLFAEYDCKGHYVKFCALFSLKHRRALETNGNGKNGNGAPVNALDFTGSNLSNHVMISMAEKLECRLFVVFHGDAQALPWRIYEIDVQDGTVVKRTHFQGQENMAEAMRDLWRELKLLKAY